MAPPSSLRDVNKEVKEDTDAEASTKELEDLEQEESDRSKEYGTLNDPDVVILTAPPQEETEIAVEEEEHHESGREQMASAVVPVSVDKEAPSVAEESTSNSPKSPPSLSQAEGNSKIVHAASSGKHEQGPKTSGKIPIIDNEADRGTSTQPSASSGGPSNSQNQRQKETASQGQNPGALEAGMNPRPLVEDRENGDIHSNENAQEELELLRKLVKMWLVLTCIISVVVVILAILVILITTGVLEDSSDDSRGRAVDFVTPSPVSTPTFLPSSTPTATPSSFPTVSSIMNPEQVAKLLASDASSSDEFGISVAIHGNTIVVGAAFNDDNGSNSGSAYVFVRTSATRWIQQAKLIASDATAGDRFGRAVAIFEDTIVVGAAWSSSGFGANRVYVFERAGNVWIQQAVLSPSGAGPNSSFGFSVAIHSNTIAVGAFGTGSAYVYVRSGLGWTQQARLTPSDAILEDQFGYAVAVDADTVIVGAFFDSDAGDRSGSAYVFVRQGTSWSEQAKLTASDAATGDIFGREVGISGDTAVVGAQWNDDAGTSSGSAYVFVRSGSTWSEQAKLVASDASSDAWYGFSVAIQGNTIVVGAVNDDTAGAFNDGGAVYIYVRRGVTWFEEAKVTASDIDPNDNFGYSVGISGRMVVVGCRNDDDGGTNTGSAYVFA